MAGRAEVYVFLLAHYRPHECNARPERVSEMARASVESGYEATFMISTRRRPFGGAYHGDLLLR